MKLFKTILKKIKRFSLMAKKPNSGRLYGDFKALLIPFTVLLLSQIHISVTGQSIGIGTTSPNANSVLDVYSSNKGLLIPRIALTSSSTALPLSAFTTGMTIYNTSLINDVSPGYYISDGTKWNKLLTNSLGTWNLTGNATINQDFNFIGTSDLQNIVFKRNNINSGLLSDMQTSWGQGALNTTTIGLSNTAFGAQALTANTQGGKNVAIGFQALKQNTFGSNNVAFGSKALFGNVVGNNNTAIGYEAGYNSIGNGNVFLGNGAGNAETGNNKLYINNTNGTASESLIYGEFDNNKLQINSSLGIGRMPALAALEIKAKEFDHKILSLNRNYPEGNFSWNLNIKDGNDLNFGLTDYTGSTYDNFLLLGNGGKVGLGRPTSPYPLSIKAPFSDNYMIGFTNQNNTTPWYLNSQETFSIREFSGVKRLNLIKDTDFIDSNDYLVGLKIDPFSNFHFLENTAFSESNTNPNGTTGLKIEQATSSNNWSIANTSAKFSQIHFFYNGVQLGNIDNNGNYTTLSDKRAKQNIAPLTGVLDKVMQLQPKTYYYIDKKPSSPLSYGFIAQDVEKIFPSFVDTKGPDNIKALAYQNFSVVAIQAIKEQQDILDKQEETLKKQEEKMAEQLKQLKILEAILSSN